MAFKGFTFERGQEVVPGTVPAWALVFRHGVRGTELCTVGSDTYSGTVSASLPAGLTGGSYEFVVEGMTAEDYRKISLAPGTPLDASLHLWWKDAPTGVLGGLARFTGLDNPLSATTPVPPDGSLVAELRVDRLWRRPGPRRMDVVVKARERVVARLAERRVEGRCFAGRANANGLEVAIRNVAGDDVPVVGHGLGKAQPTPGVRDYAAVPPGTALAAMAELSTQVQGTLGLYSQETAVIRDGTLHVGKWTEDGADAPRLDGERPMDDESGLLAVERGADLPRDSRLPPGLFGPRAPRSTFSVTALGRPDLKPGDRVSPVLPPEDFAVTEPPSLGATLLTSVPNLPAGVADPDADASVCRIIEVRHEISRERGFLTTIRAVVLAGADDGWDEITPGTAKEAQRARRSGVPFADSAQGAASTIGDVIGDLTGRAFGVTRARPAVIHDHAVSPDTPKHTSEVWHSDTAPDGRPQAAQRTEITADAHAELTQVPYVTPFAWGSYGLVLPRYPGTRVVLANVGGSSADFVDVGALWRQGGGPDARPGDYWLALPVGIDQREHLQDPARQVPPDGLASHDLVDGDGTRVIETARFVLRVTDQLTRVPDRPAPDDGLDDGSVLIESRSGAGAARIVLKGDGSVTISAKSITFDAEDRIELNTKDVRVQLDGGTMDVS
ncbi:hypothetical protein MUY14_10975 [Amycolatopsis sp. FBCC-B4732]|uniref:hypothetical protein n=1 Tax=Amycolatopsis sp. FBCC-B4732 TaxID=3079339 RepID=UPI001FF12AEC|nr:hypothetical protein [Amycolatopsis sp. FBCC-B4732]UOX91108.1 hypothetical protein MUY14_10975 [Amycolatopsis sp. FBCC-B4732]